VAFSSNASLPTSTGRDVRSSSIFQARASAPDPRFTAGFRGLNYGYFARFVPFPGSRSADGSFSTQFRPSIEHQLLGHRSSSRSFFSLLRLLHLRGVAAEFRSLFFERGRVELPAGRGISDRDWARGAAFSDGPRGSRNADSGGALARRDLRPGDSLGLSGALPAGPGHCRTPARRRTGPGSGRLN